MQQPYYLISYEVPAIYKFYLGGLLSETGENPPDFVVPTALHRA